MYFGDSRPLVLPEVSDDCWAMHAVEHTFLILLQFLLVCSYMLQPFFLKNICDGKLIMIGREFWR